MEVQQDCWKWSWREGEEGTLTQLVQRLSTNSHVFKVCGHGLILYLLCIEVILLRWLSWSNSAGHHDNVMFTERLLQLCRG